MIKRYKANKQTVILEEEEESGDNSERQIVTKKISSYTSVKPEIIAKKLKCPPPPEPIDSDIEIREKKPPRFPVMRKATRGKGFKRNATMKTKPQELKTFFQKICWEIQHLEWDKEREARNPKLFRVPRKTTNSEFSRTVLQEFKDWCISNLNLEMKADQEYLQWFVSNLNDQAAIMESLASNQVRSGKKLELASKLTDLLLDSKHLEYQKIISGTQVDPLDEKWAEKIEEKISQFFNLTKFEFIASELEELILGIDKAILDSVLVDPMVNSKGQPISNRDHYGVR